MLGPQSRPVGHQCLARKASSLAQPLRSALPGNLRGHRRSPNVLCQSGGGSNGPTGNSGGGGGGKGDGEGGSGKGPQASLGPIGMLWKGWEERVAFDPEFPFKLFIEQVIGVGFAVIGDMSSRPNWGLYELDFVFSTLVVGSILNFTIMFNLAPTAAVAGASSGNLIQKIMGDTYLKRWGAPGGMMFEPGSFTIGQRLINLLYKGTMFAGIGFFAGILGTSLTNGLLAIRKQMDPNYVSATETPNIIHNAGCWALHMGLSCNGRYQALGGVDMVLVKMMPQTAFRIYSGVTRTANNVVGGISFVTLARILGVQKSAAAPEAAESSKSK